MIDKKVLAAYQRIYKWASIGERPGGDFDWFAVDEKRNVAAFCTAGFGPIPELFFESGVESYLALVEVIERRLRHTKSLHSGGFGPYEERGLYVYDFKYRESGHYELESIPFSPVSLEDLIRFGIAQSNLIWFAGRFDETRLLNPESYWLCR
jgi:hypothetical protein